MEWFAALPALLSLLYAGWQWNNYRNWRRATNANTPPAERLPSIAVIVPFRNEAVHLPHLVSDLLAQEYPADCLEILLIDDHSTDQPKLPAQGGGARVLRLQDFPAQAHTVAHKKAALDLGIAHTEAAVIVTTDADCRWPAGGVRRLAHRFAEGADVVLGPVFIAPVAGLCDALQALDLAGYQLFTAATVAAGTPALANGAHFAYRRSAFVAVGGYRGVDHLPSGDDVLLLHKFAAQPGLRIAYATDPAGLVTTAPVAGWGAFWRQRLRWAGKAGNYASPTLSLAQVLAFVTSASILGALLLGLFIREFLWAALVAWILKAIIDAVLLASVCRHYGRGELMRWFVPVQLIYPFYLVSVGLAALLGLRAEWKGRPA